MLSPWAHKYGAAASLFCAKSWKTCTVLSFAILQIWWNTRVITVTLAWKSQSETNVNNVAVDTVWPRFYRNHECFFFFFNNGTSVISRRYIYLLVQPDQCFDTRHVPVLHLSPLSSLHALSHLRGDLVHDRRQVSVQGVPWPDVVGDRLHRLHTPGKQWVIGITSLQKKQVIIYLLHLKLRYRDKCLSISLFKNIFFVLFCTKIKTVLT